MQSLGQYDKAILSDEIAMLAVFMPIVRDAAFAYKDLWNIHKIRKQRNRPNGVSGQPQILYDFPPTADGSYGVAIDPEFAQRIEDGLEPWGKPKIAGLPAPPIPLLRTKLMFPRSRRVPSSTDPSLVL